MIASTVNLKLREYEEKEIPGVRLSNEGRRLADALKSGPGPRIEILELVSGLRVKASSWVGVLQLDDIRITVEPKLAGDHLDLPRLVDWTAGIDSLRSVRSDVPLAFEGENLFDLLARLLVVETERLIRGGLRSAYIEKQEALRVLRGRLDIDRQIRRRHGRIDVLECRFDDHSTNVPDNQLLLAGISRCAPRIKNRELKRRVDRTRMILSGICTPGPARIVDSRIRYDRLNGHYQPAHHWARTILRGTEGLESFYRTGAGRCFAFFVDMNPLFEQFVERALSGILESTDLNLSFQRGFGSVVQRVDGRPYKRLIPDTVLEVPSESVRLPIDAKYKRYSERTLDPGDVAQTFLYAFGLWEHTAGDIRRAMIIYPAETGHVDTEPIHIQAPTGERLAEITILGIPVAPLLRELSEISPSTPVSGEVRAAVLGQVSARLSQTST